MYAQGDTEMQTNFRLQVLHSLNLPPRDPRFWIPEREAGWDNSSPPFTRYIPEFGVPKRYGSIGQVEEHVRRPTSQARTDFVNARVAMGRRASPLISADSIGWNRRHYEPMPAAAFRAPVSPYLAQQRAFSQRRSAGSGGSRPSSAAATPTGTAPTSHSGTPFRSASASTRLTSPPSQSSIGPGILEDDGDPFRISGVGTAPTVCNLMQSPVHSLPGAGNH